ncbi:hypothetical protein HU200_006390 [Digitaria exilis]|uniref:Uncharacterized protein n=1 Tax=Digitaria exilis TaxID=1010633 RepID=A0A835KS21_9POAL|nr:hypothetical protein HU200_006390 [Digitaria exilis]
MSMFAGLFGKEK